MQTEQSARPIQFLIQRYHHRVAGKPLDVMREQIIIIKKGCLIVAYKDTPNKPQDVIGYENIHTVYSFQLRETTKKAIAIGIKSEEKVSISFRVQTAQLADIIADTINQKINQFNDLPDYCDLLFQQETIIEKIKESEPQYREVYKAFESKIQNNKLKALLFQNHKTLIAYQALALSKGFEINRAFIFNHAKSKPVERPQPQIFQGYDIAKTLQGIRLQDEEKKIKFTPNSQDIQEQIFFQYLPDVKQNNIWDEFQKMPQVKMELEIHQQPNTPKEEEMSKVHKIILPKPVKGKYKISQSKQIFDRTYAKQQKRKQQRVELNADLAKRVTLTLKLFYRLSKQKDTNIEEISHIEKQLYRLQNSQPKPAPFLENSINKTLKNIMKWKRQSQ